jgi:hypothetical protein
MVSDDFDIEAFQVHNSTSFGVFVLHRNEGTFTFQEGFNLLQRAVDDLPRAFNGYFDLDHGEQAIAPGGGFGFFFMSSTQTTMG